MKDLFQYVPGTSVIHLLNPVTKIFLTVVICVAAFITSSPLYLLLLLCADLAIGFLAGVPRKALGILKGLLRIAAFLFLLQALMLRRGTPVFWIFTDEGLLTAAAVVLRLIVVCMPLTMVLAVTRISDLANALVQVLHVPYKYAFTLTTAIRFIPQFLEEMSAIMEAQTARGVEFDTKNTFRKIGLMLPLCAPLLISSVRRSEATAIAAEVRGFRLRTRASGCRRYPFALRDLLAFLLCLLLLAGSFLAF